MYGFSDDGDQNSAHVKLRTAQENCAILRGTHVLLIGDSLSYQMYESWRARLRTMRYADGLDAGNARCSSGGCEGARGAMCSGYCVVRHDDNHRHSSHYSVCDNGAAVLIAEGFRWVMDISAFSASDASAQQCVRRVRRNPDHFGIVEVPAAHLVKMLASALEPARTPSGSRHPPRRLAVVYNQMAHVHLFVSKVKECYIQSAGMEERTAESAATRDVLRFWARDQARWAVAFDVARSNVTAQAEARARAHGGGGGRGYGHGGGAHSRTRSSGGDSAGDGGESTVAYSHPPQIDVYYRTSPGACDAFCIPPHGAPRAPIDPSQLVHGVFTGRSEYSHQHAFTTNDMASSAFRARGHGVLDVEDMLGVRVDAYPSSTDGVGDKLHFCQPGPPDWALDHLIRRVTQE